MDYKKFFDYLKENVGCADATWASGQNFNKKCFEGRRHVEFCEFIRFSTRGGRNFNPHIYVYKFKNGLFDKVEQEFRRTARDAYDHAGQYFRAKVPFNKYFQWGGRRDANGHLYGAVVNIYVPISGFDFDRLSNDEKAEIVRAYQVLVDAEKAIDIKDEDFNIHKNRDGEQVASVEEVNKFAEDCKSIKAKLGMQFSIFDVLKISRMEIRHSNMLAWLLDPNENHEFGGRVLQGVLDKAGFSHTLDELRTFSVYREQDNIDVLFVSNTLNEVIAIENKIGAKEGIRKTNKSDNVESQLTTYETVLAMKYPNHRKVLLFLTPGGDPPSKPTWNSISYEQLINVVEEKFKQVYANANSNTNSNKAILIADYIKTIKKDVLMEANQDLVEACRKIYNENRAAVKAVLEYGVTNVGEVVERELKELSQDKSKGLTHVGRNKFRLKSLDKVLESKKPESCWWGDGTYCCWVEVDIGKCKSKLCCSVGVVNSDDNKLAESILKLWPHFHKKKGDSKWLALPWNAKDGKTNVKNWRIFDESSTESIKGAVKEAVNELLVKVQKILCKISG